MKKRSWMILGMAAVIIAAIAVFAAGKQGYFLPRWIFWETREVAGPAETVRLSRRQVTVERDGKRLWQSDRKNPVQDVLFCDIDHDRAAELLLLCWNRGRYGSSRPFWVKEDKKTWSQHIYIYDWTGEDAVPIWMASDLGREVTDWNFDEQCRLRITDRQGRETSWDWKTWGLTERTELRFAALGDNLIHYPIYDYAFRHFEGSFDHLYDGIRETLSHFDVTSINQETPFVEEPGQYSDYPRFGTPIQVGQALADAGFSIASCATNHALDQGIAGVDRTANFFRNAGMLCPGIQPESEKSYRPYELLEKNGITCAVFSYTEMTNGLSLPEDHAQMVHTLDEEAQVRADLLAGREAADFCLVYVHWGTEYAEQPNEEQQRWAKLFADCGVDVVIGTHPHVLQPVQWVQGRDGHETLVYYSLGNFLSAQTDEACRRGGMAWFTVTKEQDVCRITDWGLQTILTTEQAGRYASNPEVRRPVFFPQKCS